MFSCVHVTASKSSSSVPKPPGIAMKDDESEAMSILRSCIVSVTISFSCCTGFPDTSLAARVLGITPVILPPAASTALAIVPISPMFPPPNTISMPSAGMARPSALAASTMASARGPLGRLEPQKTATRLAEPRAAAVSEAAAASSPSFWDLEPIAHATAAPA